MGYKFLYYIGGIKMIVIFAHYMSANKILKKGGVKWQMSRYIHVVSESSLAHMKNFKKKGVDWLNYGRCT